MLVNRMTAAIKKKREQLELLRDRTLDRTLDQYLEEVQPTGDNDLRLKYKPGMSILEALAQIESKPVERVKPTISNISEVVEIFWKAHEARTVSENKTLIEFISHLPIL